MKLKKVASLLLSGVMLLSQPAYAAGEVSQNTTHPRVCGL